MTNISTVRFDNMEELISALGQLNEDARAMTLTDEDFAEYRSKPYPVVYVMDDKGNGFSKAVLVRELLTDGSAVYHIQLKA